MILTQEEIQSFHNDGVVCLRNVFDSRWVNKIKDGIDINMRNPSKYRYSLQTFKITTFDPVTNFFRIFLYRFQFCMNINLKRYGHVALF